MPLLIAQISDTHLVAAGPRRSARLGALDRALAWLRTADPRPSLVIHTGDLTHNARPEQFLLAKERLSALDLPLIAVPGNRDRRHAFLQAVPPPDGAQFLQLPFAQFAYQASHVRVLALDTVDEGRGLGTYCENRFDHLTEMLAAGDGTPTIVALHHPPVIMPAVPGGLQFIDAEAAGRLSVILARDPTVIAVLAGHVHRRASGTLGRASVETMPSVAIDLRKGPYPSAHTDRPLVLLHEVAGNRISTRTIALDSVGPDD